MRWEDERYVRFYTRDLPEWCVLSWQARGLFGLLMRVLDRVGILPTGKLGLKAVAVAVRASWEEIEKPLQELLEDGCVVFREDVRAIVAPNFLEAQEARASDRARQRASRERARDLVNAKSLGVIPALQNVTNGHVVQDQIVTEPHTQSHDVTPSRAVPSRTVPSLAVPSRPAPASQGDPAQAIEVQIRRFPVFDALDAKAIAVQHAGRMMTSTQKLPHVLAAIESCAAKSVGLGLKTEPLQSKLIGFLWNARAPVNQEREPSKVIESPDDSPESLSTAREAAERKRTKAEAEAKRRAGLEAERKKNA